MLSDFRWSGGFNYCCLLNDISKLVPEGARVYGLQRILTFTIIVYTIHIATSKLFANTLNFSTKASLAQNYSGTNPLIKRKKYFFLSHKMTSLIFTVFYFPEEIISEESSKQRRIFDVGMFCWCKHYIHIPAVGPLFSKAGRGEGM